MIRKALFTLIFLLSCGPKFDEDKARAEIKKLIASQYQDWFALTEGSEVNDSTLIDTIPRIAQGDTILERWWQKTQSYSSTIASITFDGNTVAHVVVLTDLRGVLHFSLRKDTTYFNEEKFVIDLATRYAICSKDAASDSWRLQAISWAEVISDTVVSPTVNISEIELGGTVYFDTTLDHLWPLDRILSFTPSDSPIPVRLKTYEDTTTAVPVLYCQGRQRFVPDGKDKDTWISSFQPPLTPGHYRLVISLINRKSFFDSTYPYDSNRWVIDYEVK